MTKELKAFKELKHNSQVGAHLFDDELFEIIEPALNAVEIIKIHKLLNYVLKNEKCANMYHLSEIEKELLRGVFGLCVNHNN